MKSTIFSDVHANLPALEAVYNHITKQQPDAIFCLGDLVNQNVWNNEVVEFVRLHNIPCVSGNHDEDIGSNKLKYPFAFGSQDEYTWGLEAIKYTLDEVTDRNKIFLKNLPLRIKLEVQTGGKLRTIVFAHGTPSSNTERIYRFYKHDMLSKIMV